MNKRVLICAFAMLTASTGALAQVSQQQLTGAWGEPTGIAAYATEELQEQAGGKQTADAIGTAINEVMTRMGVKEAYIEFMQDGTVAVTSPGGQVEGTYTVSDSDLTITTNEAEFSITASMNGDKLRLYYPVAKMPRQILGYFSQHSTDGLYLGVELSRQQ